MNSTNVFRVSAGVGFLAVGLGAFGAHGLQDLLVKNGTLEIWKTAASYHLVHAVLLLALAGRSPFAATAWKLILAGVVVFSGSLYLLAVTDIRWLGAITPFGGLSLLAGWLWLAIKPPLAANT